MIGPDLDDTEKVACPLFHTFNMLIIKTWTHYYELKKLLDKYPIIMIGLILYIKSKKGVTNDKIYGSKNCTLCRRL